MALPVLAAAIRRGGPEILLSAGNHANVVAAAAHWLAGGKRTALVLKMTNPISRVGLGAIRAGVKRRLYCLAMSRASGVLVLSPHDQQEIVALDASAASKVHVVGNPYLAASPAVSPPRVAAEGAPLVLAVGRLSEQKNFGLLLEALARLKDRPWRLQLVGSGKRETNLRALAGSLGLAERVEFVGYVSDPTPYYREAKVLAISSLWEGLPAVAVEALAQGCPVVATDCSGSLTSLIKSTRGGWVTPSCPEAFAAALADALDRGADIDTAPLADLTVDAAVASHIKALTKVAKANAHNHRQAVPAQP